MTIGRRDPAPAPRPIRRAVLASLIAIPLAVLSGAQALSSSTLRRAPEIALALWPWNGLAAEEAAYRGLVSAATTPTAEAQPRPADLARLAPTFADAARAAIRREPLAVRGFAIMAMAEGEHARRRAILTTAARLTRRDQALQTLLMEEHGRAGDYPALIDALDAALRVHPEWRETFFPALAKTLAEQPVAVPAFARLLARPLPWRDGFLSAAVIAPGAPDNLAAVRARIALDDPEFDRKLIARLAADGRLAAAEQLYAQVARGAAGATAAWRADYPPFDWQLADQPGFRAQSGERPGTLEIAVSPGNGGVIAARVMRNPGKPFMLRLTSEVEPDTSTGDLRLQVACGGGGEPLVDRPFTPGATAVPVERLPDCPYLKLTVTARAWTGKPALQAVLSPLEIEAATDPR